MHTLREVRRLFSDDGFRRAVVSRLDDPDLRAFWKREFPGYSASAITPIHNKLGLLLSSPVLRSIVSQPEGLIDLAALSAGRKIVVVNLAQSLIGDDNATLRSGSRPSGVGRRPGRSGRRSEKAEETGGRTAQIAPVRRRRQR